MKEQKIHLSWSGLFIITFLVAYMYVFMEWLFTVTKPSYMNNMSFVGRLQILLVTGALLATICLLGQLFLIFIGLFQPFKKLTTQLIRLGTLLPAVVCATIILLLVDNFTYTLFKFGIVSTEGFGRALIGIGYIFVMIICYKRLLKLAGIISHGISNKAWKPKWIFITLISMILLSLVFLIPNNPVGEATIRQISAKSTNQLPNILLITSDGVDATHMSVYGYERDTTPHMMKLAESALVAENAFSNSGATAGSVISIYTSKYPTKTRVVYSPDILHGVDAHEHLPGILHSMGYKTIQIAVPHYLDANEYNLLDGFDEINANDSVHTKYLNAISQVLPSNYALFADETFKRIFDRLRHILFIKKMDNPYLQVIGMPQPVIDLKKLDYLKQVIRTAEQPIFVHIHFMGTHGGILNPMEKKFSEGQALQEQQLWSVDFYDDSILDFDNYIGMIVDNLTDLDLLDNTILVIGSDHGQKWDQLKRIPLIVRFPEGENAGRISENVQNLDIAPTLLDYLGLDQPDWMRGESLISDEHLLRPIFGVYAVEQKMDPHSGFVLNPEKVAAPFYQFGNISLIYCEKWYKLDLINLKLEHGMIEGSTKICARETGISDMQAYRWMLEHLNENGFDVSSLDYNLLRSIGSNNQ